MKKIVLIAAARPNFMKIAPISRELNKYPEKFQTIIVHTGQHYDKNMSDSFFEQLSIPKPDVNLEVGSGTHAEQTAGVMVKFEKFLLEENPDLVIVVGDVNSTMACTITAKKLHVKVAHVEAGLRSFDREMPEEINRLLTDVIADILYTPSEDADVQLLKEGVAEEKIVLVGNVMIDTLVFQKQKALATNYYESLSLQEKKYALLTLHRPSNVDNKDIFGGIIEALLEIAKENTIICPIHPRTKKMIETFEFGMYFNFGSVENNKINLIDPVGYNEMLNLTANSRLVLTDSGGLQEETTYHKVPCITLRENTERPITITEGTSQLVGTSKKRILEAYENIKNGCSENSKIPKFWDGKTAERIVDHIEKNL
jgi:UDP-N-acetylglucosamine 2-epimerase (non-hydrolysing)